ncbi:HAE1 family hydrophobic/amphiphilic exporter-1 [Elusimicrobium posterum]|uniref:efflux RND transporter permease subunit n=1 Tax=Elusimicrobium posterum TaxID=3116653 RepID=UPI003C788097
MQENQEHKTEHRVGEDVSSTGASIASIFISRPVTTVMLSLVLLVLGVMSFMKMGIDMYPNVEFPYVVVQTTLAGSGPEEIETSITKEIEEAVNTIAGIEEMNSYSMEGVSIVLIKFELEKNVDVAAQEVRDKVNEIQADLPDGTDAPVIRKFDIGALPILTIAVSANRDIIELTEMVKKQIKENIENTTGVGSIDIVGGREREIHVEVNPFKLYSLGVPISSVKQAIIDQNVEIPGGRVEQPTEEYILRILGRLPTVDSFKNIFVAMRNGKPIKVSDIGQVLDTGEFERQKTMLNGRETVSLEVKKQSGSNTLAVIEGIKERLKVIEADLPSDFKITLLSDQSGNIRESFFSVIEHLVLGGLLAALVVFIFMGSLKSTTISALAIPVSIIGAFFFMDYFGFTLNNMTLLGLTIAVGIVIDDAIVMLENIYRHMEEYGKTPLQAALDGSKEITGAIIATTASILVIFLPLAFMSGIVGRFVKSYGITVAVAIFLSGVVALTLTPMLCAKMLNEKEKKNKVEFYITKINGWLVEIYMPMLEWALRHRFAMVGISILMLVATVPMLMKVGIDFVPEDDTGKIKVSVKAPVGTSYPDMLKIFNTVSDDIAQLPYIENLFAAIGVAEMGVGEGAVNEGYIQVELKGRKDRKKITTFKYQESIRQIMAKYEGLRPMVNILSDGPGGGEAQLQFLLSGPDIDKLNEYAQAMIADLKQNPGLIDLDTSFSLAKPEYRIIVDRDKAQDLGVKIVDIASAMRTMVGGEENITKYKEGGELYEVRLRLAPEYRESIATVSALMLPSDNGLVRLDSVASIEQGFGPTQIDRYNRQRQVTVSANPNGIDLGQGSKLLQEAFDRLNINSHEYKGESIGMAQEMGKMMASFGMAFALAILFKYMILAAQFESYTHPLAILISLPLTLPFAVFSLMVTGNTFNIFSLLGLFMLIGVVSKNSILQIEYINQLREHGLPRLDAILEGNKVRLRPILMTTIALVMGVASMLFGTGSGAALRRSLAIVVIGGQTLSLLVTLLMTPVTYTLLDDLGEWTKNKFKS